MTEQEEQDRLRSKFTPEDIMFIKMQPLSSLTKCRKILQILGEIMDLQKISTSEGRLIMIMMKDIIGIAEEESDKQPKATLK